MLTVTTLGKQLTIGPIKRSIQEKIAKKEGKEEH